MRNERNKNNNLKRESTPGFGIIENHLLLNEPKYKESS